MTFKGNEENTRIYFEIYNANVNDLLNISVFFFNKKTVHAHSSFQSEYYAKITTLTKLLFINNSVQLVELRI